MNQEKNRNKAVEKLCLHRVLTVVVLFMVVVMVMMMMT